MGIMVYSLLWYCTMYIINRSSGVSGVVDGRTPRAWDVIVIVPCRSCVLLLFLATLGLGSFLRAIARGMHAEKEEVSKSFGLRRIRNFELPNSSRELNLFPAGTKLRSRGNSGASLVD